MNDSKDKKSKCTKIWKGRKFRRKLFKFGKIKIRKRLSIQAWLPRGVSYTYARLCLPYVLVVSTSILRRTVPYVHEQPLRCMNFHINFTVQFQSILYSIDGGGPPLLLLLLTGFLFPNFCFANNDMESVFLSWMCCVRVFVCLFACSLLPLVHFDC